MLIWNRIALVCAAVGMALASAAQEYGPPPYVALENEYVSVSVAPPATTPETPLADCFSFDIPFVRLIVPTEVTTPMPDVPGKPNYTRVFAAYAEPPRGVVGCSRRREASVIIVHLKAQPPNAVFHDDAVRADRVHNEVLLDNERLRVVRIRFEPGESGPMVDKRPRVIIARTDSHATVTFPDGHSEPREMKAGTVSFGTAGRQATKNTGTTPIENIVVELKGKDSEKK
jgi:hypothetical protein